MQTRDHHTRAKRPIGAANYLTQLKTKSDPSIAKVPENLARNHYINSGENSSVVQRVGKLDTAIGLAKFVAAKIKIIPALTSRYRLKPSSRPDFIRRLGEHDAKALKYKGSGQDHLEEEIGDPQQTPLPPQIEFSTRASVRAPGTRGQEEGAISVGGAFNSDALNVAATSRKSINNRLDGEIYSRGGDRTSLVVNTNYAYPIGMGIGSILMYEAFYQAVRMGKSNVREGLGEGTATQHWTDQRSELGISSSSTTDEHTPLTSRATPGTPAWRAIIGTYAKTKQHWNKL